MMLDGWTWEDMTLQADTGMHLDGREITNSSRNWRRFWIRLRYRASRTNSELLPLDLRLEALGNVLDGSLP